MELAEAGAAKLLAEIGAVEGDDAAHFVETGTHAFSDAITQGLSTRGGPCRRDGTGSAGGGQVVEVRGDNRGAVVVVAGVQDQADGVPHPFGWLYGAQLVEDKDVGVEHGPKDVEFSGLDRRVVGILDLFQQFAIVVEQAGDAAGQNQFLEDSDGQVGLAGADFANDQQALVAAGIALFREVGRDEVGFLERGVGAGEVRVVVGEFAMLVASRDAGGSQERLRPCPQLAVTTRDTAVVFRAGPDIWAGWNRFPAGTFTKRADLCGSVDSLSLDRLSFDHLSFEHLGHFHLCKDPTLLTLHPKGGSAQAGKAARLCTSCEGRARPVQGLGKPALWGLKWRLGCPNSGHGGAKQASGADFHS